MVSQIAVEIFVRWVDFALGNTALGNKRLVYPSGRYAASIQYRQEGAATIAISATAPEADIIEYGHRAVDLKTKLTMGKTYKMHRPTGYTPGTRLRRIGASPASMKPQMWAELHASEASGFARLGPNSPPGSWIIPPMMAYSPAMVLAAQAQREADRLGGG